MMMKKQTLLGALALALPLTAINALPAYNFVDLGSLGGGSSIAYGLNEQRQVVGSSLTAGGEYQAFVWQNGTMTSLGVQGIARAINNYGEIVGETGTYPGWTNPQLPNGTAFYWNNGSYTDLGHFKTNGVGYSGAYDINDNGQITGFAYTNYGNDSTTSHGFLAEKNELGQYVKQDLGSVDPEYPDGYSRGHGINEAGDIVGRGSITNFEESNKHMIHWDPAGNVELKRPIEPGKNFRYGSAEDINNVGQAIGVARISLTGANMAYIWDVNADTFQYLEPLDGYAQSYGWAINDDGIAVGYMATGTYGAGFIPDAIYTPRAFIYSADGGMTDLNQLIVGQIAADGWVLTAAYDINEFGDIVGIGTKDGQTRAFLLQVASVPVPAAAWLMGSGLVGLATLARRRQTK
jgi:probable HAF family extracellular repeat protein